MPKPLKRLELRLPANHPVWNLPEGSRSKIVKEWLEIGRRLTMIEESLQVVTEKLDARHDVGQQNVASDATGQSDTGFDKNAFLSHFR